MNPSLLFSTKEESDESKLMHRRERDKLRHRLRREKNREKESEIVARFKVKHPHYHAQKMAEYRKKDPEKFRQQNKECYRLHSKERHQKLLKKWEENPELKKTSNRISKKNIE